MPAYTENPLPFVLVLEDGTGLANSNSYISLADANTYWSANLYADNWNAASDADKQRALGMATQVIDRMTVFRGFRRSVAQALEWPRLECPRIGVSEFAYLDALRRFSEYWNEQQIPSPLAYATAHLAGDLLGGDRTAEDSAKGLQSLNIGNGAVAITFNAADRRIVFTDQVMGYLVVLGRIRGKSSNLRVRRVQ
jgi:hypothetical protein